MRRRDIDLITASAYPSVINMISRRLADPAQLALRPIFLRSSHITLRCDLLSSHHHLLVVANGIKCLVIDHGNLIFSAVRLHLLTFEPSLIGGSQP